MIKIYNLSVDDKETKIARHFRLKEFSCKDGSPMVFIDSRLMVILDVLRDALDEPIYINSAYRTPSHNEHVGGTNDSQHMYGRAADITFDSFQDNHAWVAQLAKALGATGVILYDNFMHIDVRRDGEYYDL